ncbi:uncharacterized protein LOC143145452 [Ptiloglossa arizonensis]|uniref:uncharacterized protein LOC143145452 n=1 Tax=Ptiloglossa arizonensis TaxID=3350558 RepID=UPI003F9F964C
MYMYYNFVVIANMGSNKILWKSSLQNELECKESIQDIPKSKDEQPKQQKLQKKNQYPESLLNNVKSSYIANKFVTTTKTKNEKNQENKDYIMCEKCTKKKQQKMKHVQ